MRWPWSKPQSTEPSEAVLLDDIELPPLQLDGPVWVPGLPEFMYRLLPDGTEVRARVLGVHPTFGFPISENRWEEVS